MQVEILSIPESARKTWVDSVSVGDRFPIYQEELDDERNLEIDLDWFDINGKAHCLGDLIMNRIEFKVIHEKA